MWDVSRSNICKRGDQSCRIPRRIPTNSVLIIGNRSRVPRFRRRQTSQEMSLKRGRVRSRHFRIVDVTDARELLLQETSVSFSWRFFCAEVHLLRGWTDLPAPIFLNYSFTRVRDQSAAIDLVFSDVTIKYLMSHCVSERFVRPSGIDSPFEYDVSREVWRMSRKSEENYNGTIIICLRFLVWRRMLFYFPAPRIKKKRNDCGEFWLELQNWRGERGLAANAAWWGRFLCSYTRTRYMYYQRNKEIKL